MPNTWRWLWQGGRTYPNFSISDPLCCPSRMTIMTGRYAHNTGVIDNLSSRISFHPDMRSTVQCYLKDAGYQTAFFGKFLNGWNFHRRPPCARPVCDHAGRAPLRPAVPHERRRRAARADGTTRTSPARRVDFLQTKAGDGPWFMTVSLMAPHSPYTPLPGRRRRAGAAADDQPRGRPVRPVRDVHGRPPAREGARRSTRGSGTARSGCCGRSTPRWGRSGRRSTRRATLDNTIVIYMSDNGLLLGEHRLDGEAAAVSRGDGRPVRGLGAGRDPGRERSTTGSRRTSTSRRPSSPRPEPPVPAALPARRLLAPRRVVEAEAPVRGVVQRPPRQALGAAVALDPRRRLPVHRVAVADVPRAHGLARVLRPAHRPLRAPQPPARPTPANDPPVQRLHNKLVKAAFCAGHPSCP